MAWAVAGTERPPLPDRGLRRPPASTGRGGRRELSFPMSFHQALLRPTGAYWLDGPPDLSCQDSTRQHAVDDPLLSCNLLPCPERPTTPRPSPPCPAAAVAWPPDMAEALGRRTAPSRSSGAGPGGHRRAAATGSRPAKATGQPRTRAGPSPPRGSGRRRVACG